MIRSLKAPRQLVATSRIAVRTLATITLSANRPSTRTPGAALALLLTAGAAAQCPISFAPGVSTNGGPFQWGVVAADFNGDGRPDLAIPRALTNVVAVQLAAGAPGSFLPPVTYPVGTEPQSIALADFNGDGNPDLAVANAQSNTVSILRGNGAPTGTFQAATTFTVGTHPEGIVVGDFNRDGRIDFATANEGADNISVRLANTTGGFLAAAAYATGPNPHNLACADFTGDSIVDLAVINVGGESISLLRNTGSGTFAPASTYPAGPSPIFVATADVNQDGKNDLIATNANDANVSVLLGNGSTSATFQPPVLYPVAIIPVFATAGDFNQDGRPDLAVTSFAGSTVSILRGNGTTSATFQPAVGYTVGNNANGAAVADFNLDGRPDLVVTSQGGASSSTLLLNNGSVPPVIANHPTNQSTCVSGSAPFTVSTLGPGPFSYQWQIETTPDTWQPLGNDPGPLPCGGSAFAAPFNSHSVNIGVRTCPGPFQVRCVITNDCGSTPSQPATLTICTGDFNCDGGVDGSDVESFFLQWEAGENGGDVNADGGVDGGDVEFFFTRWEAGC